MKIRNHYIHGCINMYVLKQSLLLLCVLMMSCTSHGTLASWEQPESFEESVFAIPDSLLTTDQRELLERISRYRSTEGVVWFEHGREMILQDTALIVSCGVDPSYLKMMQMQADLRSDYEPLALEINPNRSLGFLNVVWQ